MRSSGRRRRRKAEGKARLRESGFDPDRHLLLDRSHPDQGRQLLPARDQDRRGATEVLRLEVPAGRGGLDLLLPSVRAERRALDRAHTFRLHLQHQGVLASHEPPDEARIALRRHQGGASEGTPREATSLPGQAPGRSRRGGMGAVPPRALSTAFRRQTRGGPVPVPPVLHDLEEEQGLHRGGRRRDCPTTGSRWSSGTSLGSKNATSRRRSPSSRNGTCRWSAWTCPRDSIPRCRRSPRRPRTTSRWCASTDGIRRRGRRRARAPANASATTTRRTSSQEWVPKIEGLAEETRETHILMNNCYRDFAVRNARDLGGDARPIWILPE